MSTITFGPLTLTRHDAFHSANIQYQGKSHYGLTETYAVENFIKRFTTPSPLTEAVELLEKLKRDREDFHIWLKDLTDNFIKAWTEVSAPVETATSEAATATSEAAMATAPITKDALFACVLDMHAKKHIDATHLGYFLDAIYAYYP